MKKRTLTLKLDKETLRSLNPRTDQVVGASNVSNCPCDTYYPCSPYCSWNYCDPSLEYGCPNFTCTC
jgi:hypothetical protein